MPERGEKPSIREITARLLAAAAEAQADRGGVGIDAKAPRSGVILREHKKLKEAMGSYYFGPEDWQTLLGVKGVELPDIPSGLTLDLLERPDEFEPTKTIAETHALVVIPRGMSLLSLAEKATASWTDTSAELFFNFDEWNGQAFAGKESPEDTLVLIRRDFLPGSQNMTDAEQLRYSSTDPRCSPYETASMLDLQAMLFLNFLKNKERLFELEFGRCEERWDDGRAAFCGFFGADGVDVCAFVSCQLSFFGRAVRRKL